ncbi:DcaP family trimeric outer membrane transporter [Steroidobacter agaridevorans]|uniref:DcaP family trimeric outer membrane transporter n=1 Tax=Steroidobacter agaridevorans TaxID=2695856 RepID=UPI001379FEF2|nr:DcaP family trimeric outer membrane transporter [Steroidobacter agaridevorans]
MHKTRKTIHLLFLMLICGASPLSAQETTQEEAIRKLNARMAELQAQIAEIQAELAAIHPEQLAQPGSIVSTQPPAPEKLTSQQQEEAIGEATRHHQTFAQDEEDAPRLYNAPMDPTYPGFFLLPGTHTLLRIDGSARADLIYDPRTPTMGDGFIPSSIPIASTSDHSNVNGSIRGSRFMADFRIPYGESASARTFIQYDFFGPNGTTAPRLRHFYAQLNNILVGQTFTNFMDPDAFGDELDNQGVNAAVSVRLPQARYSFGLGGGASASIALEDPDSSIDFSIAGAPVTPTTSAPDLTLHLRNEWENGHLQLASTFRDLGVEFPDGRRESTFGWGVNATGGIEVLGRNSIVLGLAYGHGIARYVGDTAGAGLDAAPESQTDLSLKALPLTAAYGSYQHYWNQNMRSSVTLGHVKVQNTSFQLPDTYHKSTYSGINLIWNPIGSLDVGAEFVYGWVEDKSGANADAPRFRITARYNFVKHRPAEEKAP